MYKDKVIPIIVSGTAGAIPDSIITKEIIDKGFKKFSEENLMATLEKMNKDILKIKNDTKKFKELNNNIKKFDINKYHQNAKKVYESINTENGLSVKINDTTFLRNIKIDNPFGYTVLDLSNDKIDVEYISVGNSEKEHNISKVSLAIDSMTIEESEGKILFDTEKYYKQKYMKYKNKYLALKQKF